MLSSISRSRASSSVTGRKARIFKGGGPGSFGDRAIDGTHREHVSHASSQARRAGRAR